MKKPQPIAERPYDVITGTAKRLQAILCPCDICKRKPAQRVYAAARRAIREYERQVKK